MKENYDIQLSGSGDTVWVTAADGSCIGRFSKRFGIDVHTAVTDQMAGKSQCLFCTHTPSVQADWDIFREQVLQHHSIEVPAQLIKWD